MRQFEFYAHLIKAAISKNRSTNNWRYFNCINEPPTVCICQYRGYKPISELSLDFRRENYRLCGNRLAHTHTLDKKRREVFLLSWLHGECRWNSKWWNRLFTTRKGTQTGVKWAMCDLTLDISSIIAAAVLVLMIFFSFIYIRDKWSYLL
jgi:hypothetical protein